MLHIMFISYLFQTSGTKPAQLQTCKQNVKIIKHFITSEILLGNAWCCFPRPLHNAFFRSLGRLNQYKLNCNKHSCLSMTASLREILLRLDRDSPQLWRVIYWFRNLGHEKTQENDDQDFFLINTNQTALI